MKTKFLEARSVTTTKTLTPGCRPQESNQVITSIQLVHLNTCTPVTSMYAVQTQDMV